MKLNELNLNQVIGDFGAGALKQAGNRLTGNTEGNLSVKDKMAKDKFISDFIGRANTNLTSAIQSGLVDPNIKTSTASGDTTTPQQDNTPQPTTVQQPASPKTPEQIRKEKQAAAAQTAQSQMAANPVPAKPDAPKTPEQIRKEKQAAATQAAQGQMAPVSKLPADQFAKSAANVRQQQQTAATQTAQQQMATNPAPQGSGSIQGIKSNVDVNKLQKFNGIVDVSHKIRPAPQIKDAKGRPWTKTNMGWKMDGSDRIIDPKDSTTQSFDDAWREANGAQPGNVGVSGGQTQTAPTQQAKMTPQQTAALKGRLKAGATPASGQSGFKNYVGGSGERMTGVDKSGAPVYQKIQRESKYSKLDYILESIINIDEAQGAQSISEYLQNMFNQYLKLPKGITDPKAKQQVKTLADQAQASYPKIEPSLKQLANLGFAISYSQGTGDEQTAGATATTKPSALDAIKAGVSKGLGNAQVDTSANTATATTTSTPSTPAANTASPTATTEKEKTVYMQVKGMLDKLDKKGKQRILAALEKALGSSSTSAAPTPASDPGANAFAQMGKQVTQTGVTNPGTSTKTSTGGKVQNTGLGQVHTKSRNNPNIKRRTKAAPTTTATQPEWKGRKATTPAQPTVTAESKRISKVWGQK